ncbi:putative cyclopentanone -monooxygenase protein [Botrytis fragariae]|uniref:Putative cyclopentanone -monooxygenase protein n=1 Tax=Botrytis fragariae TaxID=1964551 RepID=A0A8H6ECQ4_9HELO|nr:putative cyclopentanone -monooxygenase protein [Botrytis fragariae]KAF5867453.1 putative cyclopentanone -monooxygenase protein [Botrytis fragariae]
MTVNGYPNLFFPAGPQGPLSFTSGPIGIEMKCGIICDAIGRLQADGNTILELTAAAQETWSQYVKSHFDGTLFLDSLDSWFLGENIPGKKREVLSYAAGLSQYEMDCEKLSILGTDSHGSS